MKLQKVGRPTTKPSCCIWSIQNQRRDYTSGCRGCIAVGYPRKALMAYRPLYLQRVHCMNKKKLCFNSLSRFAHCLYGCHVLLVVYVHVDHASVEFLIQEIIKLTRGDRALLLYTVKLKW